MNPTIELSQLNDILPTKQKQPGRPQPQPQPQHHNNHNNHNNYNRPPPPQPQPQHHRPPPVRQPQPKPHHPVPIATQYHHPQVHPNQGNRKKQKQHHNPIPNHPIAQFPPLPNGFTVRDVQAERLLLDRALQEAGRNLAIMSSTLKGKPNRPQPLTNPILIEPASPPRPKKSSSLPTLIPKPQVSTTPSYNNIPIITLPPLPPITTTTITTTASSLSSSTSRNPPVPLALENYKLPPIINIPETISIDLTQDTEPIIIRDEKNSMKTYDPWDAPRYQQEWNSSSSSSLSMNSSNNMKDKRIQDYNYMTIWDITQIPTHSLSTNLLQENSTFSSSTQRKRTLDEMEKLYGSSSSANKDLIILD